MKIKTFIQRHPLAGYFSGVFLISWGSGSLLILPKIVRGEAVDPMDGLFLFPLMVIGVSLVGVICTGIVDGKRGLRDLASRMRRWRVGVQWYGAAILIPPVLILAVLITLKSLVSINFAPNFFILGLLFGLVPGFFEEIGWTGYAFPRMLPGRGPLAASLLLGILWGLWHLPVVDSLGAATPHGKYWLPFFISFVALLTAMRVLIAWIYSNTRSVLLAQLMHASSTGFLVVLGPAHVSP